VDNGTLGRLPERLPKRRAHDATSQNEKPAYHIG